MTIASTEPDRAASETEIEITPAMIEAGVSAFLNFDSRFEGEADAVADIFRAMMAAKEASGEAAEDEASRQRQLT